MTEWIERNLSSCFIKNNFGMDCPGCGMQRAFISLLHGDLVQSFQHHPALIPLLAGILSLMIQLIIKHPKGGMIVKWVFLFTLMVTFVNYSLKQFL